MPGCLDKCYLYREYHSLEHLDRKSQIKVEKELEKYEKGEQYDTALLKDVVKKKCLGGYLKDPDNLPTNCRHYWDLLEDVSVQVRMALLEGKKNKKWKLIALVVTIVGITSSSVFAWLNFSKPSVQNLKNEIGSLKTQIEEYEQKIGNKDETIKKLTLELSNKTGEVEND